MSRTRQKGQTGQGETEPGGGSESSETAGTQAADWLPPAHELLPDQTSRRFLEVSAERVLARRLNEIGSLLFFHEGESAEERHVKIARAIEQFNSLKPRDGLEGLLAEQMVGTHHAALECLRRAALPNQTFEGRDMALRHAEKLMDLYMKQAAALDKHRGKGQQKVTVEHVNVEAGGQAIVGHVATGGEGKSPQAQATPGADGPARAETPALEHRDAVPVASGSRARKRARRG
jgi:hypothetical protein